MSTQLPFICQDCGGIGSVDLDCNIVVKNPCPTCNGKLLIGTVTVTATNEDFFQEIGHISIFFATLDMFVSQVIDELTPNPAPFNEFSTLGQKLNILGNFKSKDVTDPEKLARLKKCLKQAKNAATERNRYIHDQWIFEPELISQGLIRRSKYSLKTLDSKVMSLRDLTEFRRELGELQKIFASEIKSWIAGG